MRPWLPLLITCSIAATALGQANLVRNPSFEQDADADGVPDLWRSSGDGHVKQDLRLDPGRDGRRCARLTCTEFTAVTPASHAMLSQMDVPVRRGVGYRVAFWARGERIGSDMVSVALSDTAVWANCGLNGAFAPTPEWKRYEFIFRATRDCPTKSRLQIWFNSTGTLWVDDVVFEEAGRDLYRPGQVIPSKGLANLVPNASFECGADGWGSAEWDRTTHWGGSMNRLFGQPDVQEACHGNWSLKVDLTPRSQPVSYFDYYDLHRTPIRAPLAGNLGYLEVEPGAEYCFSVSMKAAEPGTPALLAVRQFHGGPREKGVSLSTKWQRYRFTFRPTARWCYVLAGPDLRQTGEHPNPPHQATVWLDAFQLERATEPSEFAPRQPIELGMRTSKLGNVCGWDEWINVQFVVYGFESLQGQPAEIEIRVTDWLDEEVFHRRERVPAGGWVWGLPRDPRIRGFLRLEAKLTTGEVTCRRSMRLAVIPIHTGGDARFGMNHAYPWPHLLDLCRKAGLVWVRDWSCKWQEVQPRPGRFYFTECDRQIDRPLEHGLRVLGLLPFPSAHWSSGAPDDYQLTDSYTSRREHVAYAPRDVEDFESYVGRTVSHYKDRVRWWQVFNEPVFTTYSLPRKFGYSGTDYARWTKAFARAARGADPDCKILAGIGYLNDGQIMDDWRQFLAAGGLEAADAVDIHHYPRLRPPEFIEPLLEKLNSLMDEHGGRKPIWLTEYGYYADDEPWSVPLPHSGFNSPLETERLQAEYAVRWAVIMLAGGVDKILYHAGTCDGLNGDSLQGIFYEYAGRPHKIYAAQAVMAHLFTPSCTFVKRLALGEGVKGYLFRDEGRTFAVVWATAAAEPAPIRLTDEKLQLSDLMGRPQPSRQFTPNGTPVYILGPDLSDAAFEAALSSSNQSKSSRQRPAKDQCLRINESTNGGRDGTVIANCMDGGASQPASAADSPSSAWGTSWGWQMALAAGFMLLDFAGWIRYPWGEVVAVHDA